MDRLEIWENLRKSRSHSRNPAWWSIKATGALSLINWPPSVFSFQLLQDKVPKKVSNKWVLQGRLQDESEMLRARVLDILQESENGETKCWSAWYCLVGGSTVLSHPRFFHKIPHSFVRILYLSQLSKLSNGPTTKHWRWGSMEVYGRPGDRGADARCSAQPVKLTAAVKQWRPWVSKPVNILTLKPTHVSQAACSF